MTVELSYWDSIKGSKDPAQYQAYIDRYPKGQFVELARILKRQAENSASQSSAPETARPAGEVRRMRPGW